MDSPQDPCAKWTHLIPPSLSLLSSSKLKYNALLALIIIIMIIQMKKGRIQKEIWKKICIRVCGSFRGIKAVLFEFHDTCFDVAKVTAPLKWDFSISGLLKTPPHLSVPWKSPSNCPPLTFRQSEGVPAWSYSVHSIKDQSFSAFLGTLCQTCGSYFPARGAD